MGRRGCRRTATRVGRSLGVWRHLHPLGRLRAGATLLRLARGSLALRGHSGRLLRAALQRRRRVREHRPGLVLSTRPALHGALRRRLRQPARRLAQVRWAQRSELFLARWRAAAVAFPAARMTSSAARVASATTALAERDLHPWPR